MNKRITYDTITVVRLDGKVVGEIREVIEPYYAKGNGKGYVYFPKGKKAYTINDMYPTVERCKAALEAE